MTKTKLAFVRCRLSCFSRRPVRFFPRLFPFACLLLFACRRFRCPALGLAGFFPRRIFRYRLSVFFYRLFLPAVRFAFFPVFSLLPVFPFLVCLFLRRFLYLVFLFCFFLLFFSVLFFLFYREAASGRKTGGHGRRMALKLFLPMARQKETPPKRGKFYK